MNQQNFEYLKKQLFYTGFGEALFEDLERHLQEGPPDFVLHHKTILDQEVVEALLHFRRSHEGDHYFFNRYYLQLENPSGEELLSQSFRIAKDHNITLKEAYNLMKGRSVYKELLGREGQLYHAWLQINFKERNEFDDFKYRQFHENYGFDLKAVLARYPILELRDPQQAQALIKSLEKGNRPAVTMLVDGQPSSLYLEACPQYKSIQLYNSDQLRIHLQADQLQFETPEDPPAAASSAGSHKKSRLQKTAHES